MPDSSATSRTAAKARMKRASQVVTRSAFRLLDTLHGRQYRHDSATLGIAHACPACDLGERAPAAEASARRRVEQAEIDARGFHREFRYAETYRTNLGTAGLAGNRRRFSAAQGKFPPVPPQL